MSNGGYRKAKNNLFRGWSGKNIDSMSMVSDTQGVKVRASWLRFGRGNSSTCWRNYGFAGGRGTTKTVAPHPNGFAKKVASGRSSSRTKLIIVSS